MELVALQGLGWVALQRQSILPLWAVFPGAMAVGTTRVRDAVWGQFTTQGRRSACVPQGSPTERNTGTDHPGALWEETRQRASQGSCTQTAMNEAECLAPPMPACLSTEGRTWAVGLWVERARLILDMQDEADCFKLALPLSPGIDLTSSAVQRGGCESLVHIRAGGEETRTQRLRFWGPALFTGR